MTCAISTRFRRQKVVASTYSINSVYCSATGVLWGKRSEQSVGMKRAVQQRPGTKAIPPGDVGNAAGHMDEYLLSQVGENGRNHGVPWTSRVESVQTTVWTDMLDMNPPENCITSSLGLCRSRGGCSICICYEQTLYRRQ